MPEGIVNNMTSTQFHLNLQNNKQLRKRALGTNKRNIFLALYIVVEIYNSNKGKRFKPQSIFSKRLDINPFFNPRSTIIK